MALEFFPLLVQERLAATNTITRAGESMATVEQRVAGAVAMGLHVTVKNPGVGPPKHPVGVAAADRPSGASASAAAPVTPNIPSIFSNNVEALDPTHAAYIMTRPWLRPHSTAPRPPPSPAVSIAGSSERGTQREEDKAAASGLAFAAGSGGEPPAARQRKRAVGNPAGKTGPTIGVSKKPAMKTAPMKVMKTAMKKAMKTTPMKAKGKGKGKAKAKATKPRKAKPTTTGVDEEDGQYTRERKAEERAV